MKGQVDELGRALIALPVKAGVEAAAVVINVWIDTAFDGDLVIPTSVIENLGLTQSAAIQATCRWQRSRLGDFSVRRGLVWHSTSGRGDYQ